jgi:hypothetical protein
MPHYAVRITHAYSVAQKIVAAWALKSERMAVFEHEGEKTGKIHIHLALYGTSVDKKQLRNIAAATLIPVKGNENMAFEEWDGLENNYCYYMTKGHIDASYLLKYTQVDVEQWKSNWVEPKVYKKVSPWTKFWNSYEPHAPLPAVFDAQAWLSSPDLEPPKNDTFEKLVKSVHKYVYALHGGVWCPQMSNEKKCLINTYCDKHKLKKPEKWFKFVED